MRYSLLLSVLLLTAWCGSTPSDQRAAAKLPPSSKKKISFKDDIVPLLKARCFECHQGTGASSGVRLDSKDDILGKTDGVPLVRIGKSKTSRLIHVVTGQVPDRVMPKTGRRLTDKEVGLLRAWIDQGMAWDDAALPVATELTHWAFRPVQPVTIPSVESQSWVSNPIDAFIAAKQESKNLTPAPEAPRRRIIRRLSLDLLGIPPTPEQVDRFASDKSPNAYEKLVERLLASPSYGERWARHWLDVARWAESEGYESNHLRPFSWRYRDYVVRAFNTDKPYNQFIREQIAGDEMVPYSDENLIATGFLAAARLSSNEEDVYRQRNDVLVDIVNATSSTFLGLTMNCAQCHNHKFDPITQRDYYRLGGFFLQGQPLNVALKDKELVAAYVKKRKRGYDAALELKRLMFEQARRRYIAETRKKLSARHRAALDIPRRDRTHEQERVAREAELKFQLTPNQIERNILPEDRTFYAELKKKIDRMRKTMLPRPQTFGFYSPVTSPHRIDVLPMKGFYPPPYDPETLAQLRPQLLVGGDVHRLGSTLEVGWPEAFGKTPKRVVKSRSRMALANWIADKKNPLTGRVWVNRLWHYHFGQGLVSTPGDFGKRGAVPTHPKLLDWLAAELMKNDWSTKHIHRLIVTSSTYRQDSRHNKRNAKIDSNNGFLWHWKPRRLEAEAIRDSILAVSGQLNRSMGGTSDPADQSSRRRSLYLLQKRDRPTPISAMFDGPSAVLESCSRRHVSTVPLQALYLLNNEQIADLAKSLANRVRAKADHDRDKQIRQAFLLVLGREPDGVEREIALRFFDAGSQDAAGETALYHFCQGLMNLNEFLYLE